jgi:hypothetical protein
MHFQKICLYGVDYDVQGCCSHKDRWKPGHAADRDEENLAALGLGNVLLVHFPVDLAWSNLAYKVRWLLPSTPVSQGKVLASGGSHFHQM